MCMCVGTLAWLVGVRYRWSVRWGTTRGAVAGYYREGILGGYYLAGYIGIARAQRMARTRVICVHHGTPGPAGPPHTVAPRTQYTAPGSNKGEIQLIIS